MNPIYFTVTGTNYYYGNEYFKPEIKLQLIKEPDNKADKEAIRVELEGVHCTLLQREKGEEQEQGEKV